MRHLPNLLTLANLFCGCLAIVCLLNAQPFLTYHAVDGSMMLQPTIEYEWVHGVQQIAWGGSVIFLAAFFDLLDGFAARALRVHSPIGKDLDSLADVVSFGVAPSVIMYKLIWESLIGKPGFSDVNLIWLAPAFAIAIFAALRLAKFNVTPAQQGFSGMPTPAVGLFVASFALLQWQRPELTDKYLGNIWVLYAIIAILCYLMVSKVHFMKGLPQKWSLAQSWPNLVLIIGAAVLLAIFRTLGIPMAFALYILLSFAAPKRLNPDLPDSKI